ncbi:NADPH oxidase organizer 1 [Gastrophryne carolinensis]
MSRYPVEVKALGLIEHGKEKLYMLSILWSDHNNIIIYRTYNSFKDLSKQLTKMYPLEAGLINKSERILPVLKDVPLLFWSRFSSRFMERLNLLEVYSKELLQTDSRVSRCETIIQFFSPTNQDLTPSFPENSLVLLPSENDQKQKKMISSSSSDVTAIQSIVSDPYICVDAYETKDTKNRLFKVQKDEQVDVLIKDPTGWWLVENEEKRLAWFPAPYLAKLQLRDIQSKKTSEITKGKFYYADTVYEAQNPDEISLSVGIIVEVLEQFDNGWWMCCYNGRFGCVPAMFLKPYINPHQNLKVMYDHERFSSTPNLVDLEYSRNRSMDTGPEIPWGSSGDKAYKIRSERMVSKSLCSLQDLDTSAQNFISSSVAREVSAELHKQDSSTLKSSSLTSSIVHPQSPYLLDEYFKHSPAWTMNKTEPEEVKARRDSNFSTSPKRAFFDTPPPIPQKPSLHEIRSECTTVTRRAVLQQTM